MDEAAKELTAFAESLHRIRKKNRHWEVSFVIIGIVLSSAVTFIGIFGGKPWLGFTWTQWSGGLGALLTLVLSLNRAFGFGEKARSYRIVEFEAINLADDPTLSVEDRWKRFNELRTRLAQIHAGEGIEAISKPR